MANATLETFCNACNNINAAVYAERVWQVFKGPAAVPIWLDIYLCSDVVARTWWIPTAIVWVVVGLHSQLAVPRSP